MEIVQQRLEQEADVDLVQTAPNVTYQIVTKRGEQIEIHKPQDVPDTGEIDEFRQPIVRVNLVQPVEFIGAIMKLCMDKRGFMTHQHYLTEKRVELTFELPLSEIVFDFYDRLKSISKGYASFDYAPIDYRRSDLVKMDIKLNGENVDALSALVHRDKAASFGRGICKKLKVHQPLLLCALHVPLHEVMLRHLCVDQPY